MIEGQPRGMMIGRVRPAALPDLRPALRLTYPAQPLVRRQERLLVLRHEAGVLRRTRPRRRLDWAGRAILATLIRLLPRKLRAHRLFTPGTGLAARCRLIARNWTHPRQTGRLPVSAEMTALIECLAIENASWVYQRIQGKLLTLGYRAGRDIT